MTGCRISRVRMKAGGADLRILHRELSNDCSEVYQSLNEFTSRCHEYIGTRAAGYAVVMWGTDGTSEAHSFCGTSGPVPISLLPSYVADALRRRIALRDKDESWR